MIDNYDLWRMHDADQNRRLEQFPSCSYCSQKITDDFVIDIYGEIYHEDCFMEQFRKPIEDYIE